METQFILALFQHGYKARTSTLFHLLKGKRTSSVLIYGFLFDNLRFFGAFPELSKKKYDDSLNLLEKRGLLIFSEDSHAQLTEKGVDHLLTVPVPIFSKYPWIDYFRFGKTDEACWRMLQFSVQIISYLSYEEKRYVPLEQSPLFQQYIKKIIKKYPKKNLIEQIKKEWFNLFSELPVEVANFFANQFTGYHHIGQLPAQLITEDRTVLEQELIFKNRLHRMLSLILLTKDKFILNQLVFPMVKQNENKSMKETLKYIDSAYSVVETAKKRNIKVSTVKDHLLEASIIGSLKIDQLLTKAISTELDQIKGPVQEWQYHELKIKITELDYFDFRLYQIKKKQLEQGVADGTN